MTMRRGWVVGLLMAMAGWLSGCQVLHVEGHRGLASDHFDGERFQNLDPFPSKSLWTALKWRLSKRRRPWPEWIPSSPGPVPPRQVRGGRIRYTFVNHSTFLLQFDGLNVLTDPQWSERAGPYRWLSVKRHRAPGVRFEALPPIHVVVISHNHYDHMDLATLRRLEERDHPLFFAGLGNAAYLKKFGLRDVRELDWWDSATVGPAVIHFVPVQHWSRRGFFDMMRTLWGGYVIESPSGKLFFAGDTGYGRHFRMIRERFGRVDLAFFPIGSYEPRWFMKPAHVNPEEAVQAHLELGARQSVGMHFGTFQVSDEAIDEPPRALALAREKLGVSPNDFSVPEFGQSYEIGGHHASRKAVHVGVASR